MTVSSEIRQADVEPMAWPIPAVEACMAEFIEQRPLAAGLRDAVRYALFGGGKRLRPILVVRCCEAVGGRIDQAVVTAAAIEMIHTFSLVHDDLPAMDDDDLRRGRPTLHKHAGEAMAILAGDVLVSMTFELVATRMGPSLAGPIAAELAAATTDMIAGQVYDTLPDPGNRLEPMGQLLRIHRHKTAALLRAACRMGAICGGADDVQLQVLTRFADSIGLMFQVVDDLLDVTGSTQQLGKAAGKDAGAGKLTYPGLIGIEASRLEVDRLRDDAVEAVAALGPQAEPLRRLCSYMAARQH